MSILSLPKLLLLVGFFGLSHADCLCKLRMKTLGLIGGDYANDVCTTEIDVLFQNGPFVDKVDCGKNKLSFIATENVPKITFDATNKCRVVSILFFNPDTYINYTPYVQGLIINVPSADLKNSDMSRGDLIFNYVRPGSIVTSASDVDLPPPLDQQKFTFFIYCQAYSIYPGHVSANFNRTKFSPKVFASTYRLGNPLAANFFYMQSPIG